MTVASMMLMTRVVEGPPFVIYFKTKLMASIRQAPLFAYTNFKLFCRCSSLRQSSSVSISGALRAPEIESLRSTEDWICRLECTPE